MSMHTAQMTPEQAKVFIAAAKLYGVYILVRRTNPASLERVSDPMCVPKRLDCKAKTADKDYVHPKFGPKRTAGLVVDPTVTGPFAFRTNAKYEEAMKQWADFSRHMLDPAVGSFENQRKLTYVPNGRFYFVDLDPASERFSCVKFSISSVLAAGKYIHGDFDLYGIVPASDPRRNVAVHEQRLGQKHVRHPEFFDVQHFVNKRLGVPMILHGAMEGYSSEHPDEGIDIFHPDGRVSGAENAVEIARLYETVFKGRRLFTKDGPKDIVRGMFKTPG
jgi:hypothetical protein